MVRQAELLITSTLIPSLAQLGPSSLHSEQLQELEVMIKRRVSAAMRELANKGDPELHITITLTPTVLRLIS